MAKLKDKAMRRLWGTSDARQLGYDRAMRGLRKGDDRDLYFGLAVSALAWLQRSKPKKELIHRQTVSEGSAIVIHHKKSGTPRLEIVKPKKRRRS